MRKHLSRSMAAWILTLPSGCSHVQERFGSDLAHDQCESALANLPNRDPALHLLDQAQTAAGTAVSYSATGAAYLGDVLVTVTGGAVIVVALCGPIIALAAAAGHSGIGHGTAVPLECLPADHLSSLHLTHLGKDTYNSTRQWRCPDLSHASQSLRKVAACFGQRGDPTNLAKAKSTLASISATSNFNACVSADEKKQIDGDLKKILDRMENPSAPGS